MNKKKTNTKTIKRTKKIGKIMTYILIAVMTVCCSSFGYASAAPAGVDTTMFTKLLDMVLWAARAILIVMVIAGIVKTAEGRVQERPSEMYMGLITMVVCGVMFAITFAVPDLVNF